MQTSNVLVIGHPRPAGLDIGANFVPSFKDARVYLTRHQPAVLVFGATRSHAHFTEFCEFACARSPDSLWIFNGEQLAPAHLVHWSNAGKLHDIIDDFDDPELEAKLQAALEVSGEQAQRRQLTSMFEDQSARLKRLSADLEARVQKRHKALRKSLRTLEETKTRMEAFHKALLGIHRASTILQMEQTLNEALRETIDIEWVRVRFANQSSMMSGQHILAVELPFQYEATRGEVLYAKADGKRFAPDEVDYLQELSEALALALARLHKLEQAESLKAEWQATFDAIPHPLCLVADEFEILKLNRAFQEGCARESFRSLLGKNCFHVFFKTGFEPPTPLESPFTFRNSRETSGGMEHFEVTGQRLGLTHDNKTRQLILLRPITEEVRFERRILEASKLAELGTIGSSIAHELNNPLGGMLSFLQLILMDLKRTDPLHADVKAMEAATLRCRDIVLNLLSFARKQDLGDLTEIDLREIIERAVKLIELQSKSMGITISVDAATPAPVRASPNALSQALCNVLQNSIDAISEKMKVDLSLTGSIQLHLETAENRYQLKVADNGTGMRPEVLSQIFNPLFSTRDPGLFSGMGLTTAFTIVSDHGGTLEVLSQTAAGRNDLANMSSGTTAIFSLPRLDHSLD